MTPEERRQAVGQILVLAEEIEARAQQSGEWHIESEARTIASLAQVLLDAEQQDRGQYLSGRGTVL